MPIRISKLIEWIFCISAALFTAAFIVLSIIAFATETGSFPVYMLVLALYVPAFIYPALACAAVWKCLRLYNNAAATERIKRYEIAALMLSAVMLSLLIALQGFIKEQFYGPDEGNMFSGLLLSLFYFGIPLAIFSTARAILRRLGKNAVATAAES